jgi:enamine deaminase RidA (YjgF/YER057c/UK114 family)
VPSSVDSPSLLPPPRLAATSPRASLLPAPRAASAGLDGIATLKALEGESAPSLLERLAALLAGGDRVPALVMIFGRRQALAAARRAVDVLPGGGNWPVLAVEGRPCHAGPFAGLQAFLISRDSLVRTVSSGGRAVGTVFEDAEARHCLLGGIGPDDPLAAEGEQTRTTLARLCGSLSAAGFDLAEVARTWFYNREILRWYGDFNRVRTAFYRAHPFRAGASPASTGIEGANADDAALAIAAWAVQPKSPAALVAEVLSPLQCPAPRYGSTFSRAMEIRSAGWRRLLVSGTASIALSGESVHLGDPERQIARTMEVIGALLDSRRMTLRETVRATAYVKHPEHLAVFEHWLAEQGLDGMPYVPMTCDVCRDDLLFELELDAWTQD